MTIQCPDCLAHYPEQYDKHDCPPWLKALVTRHKEQLKREAETGKHCCPNCLEPLVQDGPHQYHCPCSPGLSISIG